VAGGVPFKQTKKMKEGIKDSFRNVKGRKKVSRCWGCHGGGGNTKKEKTLTSK